MRSRRVLGVVLVVVGLTVSSDSRTEPPKKSASKADAAGPTATVNGQVAAMTVYKDPVTGAFGPPPAEVESALLDPKLAKSTSTSGAGLVPVPNPNPGGGIMIDLKGRFMSAEIATVEANGKVSIECGKDKP